MNMIKQLKKRPDAIWLLPITISTIIFQVLIVVDSIFRILPIAEDSALQIMATGAEIIAGLYGLTLTGYIFFMDYLQEQIRDNALIAEVVMLLRRRYYKMICIISVESVAAIIVAIILNFYDLQSQVLPLGVLRFFVNETFYLMIGVVFAIVYFVLDIVNPDKIARVSQKHKELMEEAEEEIEKVIPVDIQMEEKKEPEEEKQFDKKHRLPHVFHKKETEKVKSPKAPVIKRDEKGDLQEFLDDYNEIENILRGSYKGMSGSQFLKNPFNPVSLREILIPINGQNHVLFAKVTRLHQYYSYMMFGHEQTVSKKMCELAKEVKAELLSLQTGEYR